MAREIKYTCDLCGDTCAPLKSRVVAVINNTMGIYPWNHSSHQHEGGIDCCGDACVIKKVSEFLSKKV